MFCESDNVNFSECVGIENLSFTGAAVKELNPPQLATRALLQFYTNEAGVNNIGPARMSYVPIVSLTESGTAPQQGFGTTAGVKLFNMSIYEVKGLKNLAQTQFVAFANGYACFCFVQYYR